MMVHPEMALGLAIVVAFLSESTHHGAELRRMQRDGRELATQLRAANGQVENLERALTRRHIARAHTCVRGQNDTHTRLQAACAMPDALPCMLTSLRAQATKCDAVTIQHTYNTT